MINFYVLTNPSYIVTNVRTSEAAGFVLVPSGQPTPAIGDAFKDGVVYKHPAPEYAPETDMYAHAYSFNPTIPAWEVDYGVFDPRLVEVLRYYRRRATNNAPAVIREFESEELGIKPDDESLNAIMRKDKVAKENTDETEVEFRFATYTALDALDIGNRVVPYGFLSDFFLACDAVNQLFRTAESETLKHHRATPFFTVDEAFTYFDNYVTNNS